MRFLAFLSVVVQPDLILFERPTIADIAVFPYIALAPDGKLDLSPYPHVLDWIERVKQLPGYIAMAGL